MIHDCLLPDDVRYAIFINIVVWKLMMVYLWHKLTNNEQISMTQTKNSVWALAVQAALLDDFLKYRLGALFIFFHVIPLHGNPLLSHKCEKLSRSF